MAIFLEIPVFNRGQYAQQPKQLNYRKMTIIFLQLQEYDCQTQTKTDSIMNSHTTKLSLFIFHVSVV